MTLPSPSAPPDGPSVPAGGFRTTHWSLVLQAGHDSVPGAEVALEQLCQAYWYPLYVFVRRKGYGHEDAQDLVQGFFGDLLARRDLAGVHPEKGRFRTFLLTALSHHLANEWDRSKALKRGGAYRFVPLESEDPEARYRVESTSNLAPEAGFDRAWAEETLRVVLGRLRSEAVRDGSVDRFEALKGCLLGERNTESYTDLAVRLNTTEAGIKSAVHRLRRRLREVFREEISRVVAAPEEVDDELRHLVRVMTG